MKYFRIIGHSQNVVVDFFIFLMSGIKDRLLLKSSKRNNPYYENHKLFFIMTLILLFIPFEIPLDIFFVLKYLKSSSFHSFDLFADLINGFKLLSLHSSIQSKNIFFCFFLIVSFIKLLKHLFEYYNFICVFINFH